MPATLEFRLKGHGWMDCALRLGERGFVLEGISYTTDALGDMARMALMIATGAPVTTVSFDREPAEWRIVATSLGDTPGTGHVSIAIYSFADANPNAALSEGDLAFTGDCGARARRGDPRRAARGARRPRARGFRGARRSDARPGACARRDLRTR